MLYARHCCLFIFSDFLLFCFWELEFMSLRDYKCHSESVINLFFSFGNSSNCFMVLVDLCCVASAKQIKYFLHTKLCHFVMCNQAGSTQQTRLYSSCHLKLGIHSCLIQFTKPGILFVHKSKLLQTPQKMYTPCFHHRNFPQELGTLSQYSVYFPRRNQNLNKVPGKNLPLRKSLPHGLKLEGIGMALSIQRYFITLYNNNYNFFCLIFVRGRLRVGYV